MGVITTSKTLIHHFFEARLIIVRRKTNKFRENRLAMVELQHTYDNGKNHARQKIGTILLAQFVALAYRVGRYGC